MLVNLIGKKVTDFEADGKKVKGIKLYFTTTAKNVEGQAGCEEWINYDNALYKKISSTKIENPIVADITYEINPLTKKAVLTGIDISE